MLEIYIAHTNLSVYHHHRCALAHEHFNQKYLPMSIACEKIGFYGSIISFVLYFIQQTIKILWTVDGEFHLIYLLLLSTIIITIIICVLENSYNFDFIFMWKLHLEKKFNLFRFYMNVSDKRPVCFRQQNTIERRKMRTYTGEKDENPNRPQALWIKVRVTSGFH